MKRSDYKYTAFISYRHIEPDASIAAALHRAIETFKAPKEFYEEGKAPSFRVFRDREELSARDLSDSIEEALRDSYYLIVISSKRTPLSTWCTKEVELFRKLHGDERILSVLIEGEPYESFSKPMMELKKKVEIQGQEREEALELLAAELRPKEVQDRNFPGYEEIEQKDPTRLKRLTRESIDLLKTEKYRVMAAILGCSYGDLRQRDKERKNRLYLQISGFLASLFLIFGLFMFRAYQQENIARIEATQTSSTMLLKRSRELLDQGDKIKSLLVAQEAMAKLDEKMDLYPDLKEQHKGLLSDALYPVSASLRTRIDTDNTMSFMDISPTEDLLAVGLSNSSVGLFDSATGELLKKLEAHKEQVKIVSFSKDGNYLLSAGFDSMAYLWDVHQGKVIRRIEVPGIPMMASFSKDGNYIFLAGDDAGRLRFMRQDLTGKEEKVMETERVREISVSRDGKQMLVLFYPREGSYCQLYDFEESKWKQDYFEPREKEKRTDIVMLRFASDEKSFYMRSHEKLYRIPLEGGEPLFAVDFRFWEDQVKIFAEYNQGKSILVADNSVFRELDSDTGEELSSVTISDGIITEVTLHKEGGMVALSLKSGKVALWKEGVLLDSGVDLLGARPTQLIFHPKGDRLYVASKSTKEIYYLDLESSVSLEPISGQIASVSSGGKKALFYDSKNFFVWDTAERKQEKLIPNTEIRYTPSYIFDGFSLALSDDGKWLSYYDYNILDGKRQYYLVLHSMETGTSKEFPLESGNYLLSFTPDSQYIALAKQDNRLMFMDFQGTFLPQSIPLPSAALSMVFSEDGEKVGLNLEQGKGQVFTFSGEKLYEFPGQILWIDGEEVRGIYNRSAYVAKKGEPSYHHLDQKTDQVPVSTKDINLYDAASKRLLLIRNGEEKPVTFLVDFESGRLLKSFFLPLNSYRAKGFFQGKDRDVVLDQSSDFSQRKEDGQEVYYNHPKSLQFHFAEYDVLLKEEELFFGKRKLSPDERKELGLEE